MQNKREFWNNELHLEEIKLIINNIIERKNFNFSLKENYELNNLNYEISINNNGKEFYLIIECNDGRKLIIDLNLMGRLNGDDICMTKCTYKYKPKRLEKEEKIEFISNKMRILEIFGLKYIDEFNLVDSIKYDKYNEYNKLRRIDLLNDETFIYNCFSSEGVSKYYCTIIPDGYFIKRGKDIFFASKDFELLNINGQEVCDYEKIKEFNYEDELEKMKTILKQNSSMLNPLTISSIDGLIFDFEKKSEIIELSKLFYEKGILDLLKEFTISYDKMKSFIMNFIFTKEELLYANEVICVMVDSLMKNEEKKNLKGKVLQK